MSAWRDHVSADTKIMIEKLCDLNKEQETIDKKQTMFLLIFLASVIFLFIYALLFIVLNDASLLKSILNFFKKTIHILLLLVPLILFSIHLYFRSNYFAASDQFEDLRHEVIDHLKSSWLKNEHTSVRDEISKEMESNGINIRYKSISHFRWYRR